MFSKILSALSLANSFKAMIFKRLSSPVQSAYLGSLVWDIINILNRSTRFRKNLSNFRFA